jgi:hypothetical protein
LTSLFIRALVAQASYWASAFRKWGRITLLDEVGNYIEAVPMDGLPILRIRIWLASRANMALGPVAFFPSRTPDCTDRHNGFLSRCEVVLHEFSSGEIWDE